MPLGCCTKHIRAETAKQFGRSKKQNHGMRKEAANRTRNSEPRKEQRTAQGTANRTRNTGTRIKHDARGMNTAMKQINEHIKQGNYKQVYLLYGEERYLRRQYRDKLRKALCEDKDTMNTHFYEGKNISVEEIIDLAETLPFLAQRRVIFITDSGLFKSGG